MVRQNIKSKFQKRHYKVIAEVISHLRSPTGRIDVANAFVFALGNDNKNFNQVKFLEACGIVHHVIKALLEHHDEEGWHFPQ